MFQIAVLGALVLAIIIFCAKFMRRGYTSLDDNRKKYLAQIELNEKQVCEDRKRMASCEHLHIMRVALEDLIRLEKDHRGFSLESSGMGFSLGAPNGTWHVELLMRERKLRSCARTLHGQGRWLLEGPGYSAEYAEVAELMSDLNQRLHSSGSIQPEPEHFARRMGRRTMRRRPARVANS